MKKINIPFFKEDEEILKSIKEIRNYYLSEYNIIGSELTEKIENYLDSDTTHTTTYTSGVNIFIEKNENEVKNILPQRLKTIYSRAENETKSNTKSENSSNSVSEELFPNINYQYWMNLNPFYSDNPLLSTMKTCIRHYASLPGLINDVVQNIDTITCKSLVRIIEMEIKDVVENNSFNDESKILRIFDLISGWGGQQGRAPYLRPIGETTRNSYKNWYNSYITGVKLAIEGKKEGLNSITKIRFIGDSFGTKHLYFWSLYGGNEPIPIYDARIKTLLYLNVDGAPGFEQYLQDMINFAKSKNISISQLEKALFAFSSNYFPNETLNIKNDRKDNTDYNEAKRLEVLYNSTT